MLAIGLIILLVCSVINTVKNIFTIEQEKRAAVLANEAKGQFLASMSHEIRTPINAVIGMDEMILRETTDKNIRGYAMDIQSAGQSLLSLINDILDLSKIESGKMEIISIEYDFSSLIHDIVNMIRIKAENKELQVNLFVESSIPSRLFGDDVRIRQILINLLNNAVKYTQEGSVTLSVTGTQEKDTVMLHFSVKDTGIGIKAEDLPKLTEKFGRIEEKRNREIEGTGLGLHITGQLLQLMNSKLSVESVYGEGSCFYFDLLQKIVDYEPIGNLEERIRNQESSYMYNASFMAPEAEILVVDDSAVNRKVFVNLLKETKLRIDQADGGMSCLEMTENKKYDLIFLDHMMPDLDGIETLHRMKASEHNLCADTPIVALTANAIIGAKEMYLAEGFDDFLTKPVASGKLEKMILKYLPEEKVQECGNCSEEPVMSDSENDSVKELLSQIPDINLEYALLLNGTAEHVYEGMMDFIELADAEADELETFFESIDMPEGLERYRIKVHAMKSSAAVIGAMQLSGLARALEMAAKDERNEDIRNVTPVFLREWRKCKETVSTVLYKQEREAEDKAEFHKELFLGQMDMLADALTEMDIDTADQIVEMLKQYRYPDSISESMKQIYTAEKELDADKVILLYAAIKEQL
ncbi:MAG: ATP-binding protein [Lachnospiraceae bacterium]